MAGLAQDEAEMEKIAEDELAKLRRQFRIMEMERAAVCGGTRATLRTQRNTIEILNRELDEIMLQLKLIKSPSNIAESARVRDKLSSLLRDHDKLSGLLRAERGQVQEVEFLLTQVQNETMALKTNGPKSGENNPKTPSCITMVSQLENRLHTVLKRFNSTNTYNQNIREEIDKLLLDRQSFNAIWKVQMKKLLEGKAQMLDLVEQSIATYDQREEWCAKLEELKNRAANEFRKHCLDIRDLQRQLDHSVKLEEFLRIKGTARVTSSDAKAEARRLEAAMREQETLDNCVSILDAIKEFTGETDVDRIIQEFSRREEENYALFNYVNEVSAELKLIHDNVENLKICLEDERSKHEARLILQQESIEGLRQALEEHTGSNADMREEITKSSDTLEKLLLSIYDMALASDCESMPLVKLLGDRIKINENNVRLYLKCIEKKIGDMTEIIRTDEILRRQLERTPPSTRRKSNLPRPRRSPRSPRDGATVVAPTTPTTPTGAAILRDRMFLAV